MIKYHPAPDIEQRARDIAGKLEIAHDFSRIKFIRSTGSQSRRTLARCHAFPRVLQAALGMKAHYVIEVISENYDKLSTEEKSKTIIHELMHVPKSMGGGFRHHDFVCDRNIEKLHKLLKVRGG
jgi:predicted metallopeptidase